MPGRTKGDFIGYARTKANIGRKPPVYEGVSRDFASTDGGNETSWGSLLETDAGYDGPTEESGGSSGYGYDSDPTIAGERQDQERRIYQQHSSSTGTYDPDGDYDIPIRNVNSGSNQLAGAATGGRSRVTRTRTSAVDRFMGVFGGHSPKAPKTKTEKAISITRKLLTLQEITRNKPVLIKLVLWTSDHADDLLTATTKGHAEVIIWSNLEYDDAELLVDHFLSMGQKSEYWADAVRKTLEWEEKVKLGAIIIPRAVKTIVYLFTTGIEIRW